jgi:ABC-type glycerol-3-phosphate transport system substrate-binding protein
MEGTRMTTKFASLILGLLVCLVVAAGCGSGETSQADVNDAAKQLNDAAKGVEPQPDPAVVDFNSRGQGAPKPGTGK